MLSATGCEYYNEENQVKIRVGRRVLVATDCECYKVEDKTRS